MKNIGKSSWEVLNLDTSFGVIFVWTNLNRKKNTVWGRSHHKSREKVWMLLLSKSTLHQNCAHSIRIGDDSWTSFAKRFQKSYGSKWIRTDRVPGGSPSNPLFSDGLQVFCFMLLVSAPQLILRKTRQNGPRPKTHQKTVSNQKKYRKLQCYSPDN